MSALVNWHRSAWLAIIIATAFTVLLINNTASAAQICGKREYIEKQLETKHKERSAGIGITGNGMLAELFVSPKNGTWTFAYTRPDGITCLLAAGSEWSNVSNEAKDEEAL